MKKLGLSLVVLLVAVTAWSQVDPFLPPHAITMGQGGAYTANAEGYNAFFYNPAGFARDNELTLASVNVYGLMDRKIFDIILGLIGGGQAGGGTPAPNAMSRASTPLPPELQGIISQETYDQLSTTLVPLVDYINDAQAANPTSVDTALAAALAANNIQVPDAGSGMDSFIAALTEIVISNPAALDTVLNTFVTELQTASGVPAPSELSNTSIGTILTDALKDAFPSGNVRGGAFVGLGWVGSGLGIGLFANSDVSITTPVNEKGESLSLLAARGRALISVSVVGGLGFNLFEGFSIGASIRPTLLGYADVNPAKLLPALLGGGSGNEDILGLMFANGIYKGFRVGVDVGALWDLGPFTFGAAIKDLIPYKPDYKKIPLSPFDPGKLIQGMTNFAAGEDLTDAEQAAAYQPAPLKVNIGARFHPDLGVLSSVIDPSIGIDIWDLFGFFRDYKKDPELLGSPYNFLRQINVGAEVKLLQILSIRAGINQGSLTGGVGLHLLFLDINAAVSATDLKEVAGKWEFTAIGGSVEVAIRF